MSRTPSAVMSVEEDKVSAKEWKKRLAELRKQFKVLEKARDAAIKEADKEFRLAAKEISKDIKTAEKALGKLQPVE